MPGKFQLVGGIPQKVRRAVRPKTAKVQTEVRSLELGRLQLLVQLLKEKPRSLVSWFHPRLLRKIAYDVCTMSLLGVHRSPLPVPSTSPLRGSGLWQTATIRSHVRDTERNGEEIERERAEREREIVSEKGEGREREKGKERD